MFAYDVSGLLFAWIDIYWLLDIVLLACLHEHSHPYKLGNINEFIDRPKVGESIIENPSWWLHSVSRSNGIRAVLP
jgi:hypothetical protein